jgi:hypothetical protein
MKSMKYIGRSTKREAGSTKREAGSRAGLFLISLNADRSKDAVRFEDEAATADLTACEAPVNVGKKRKENIEYRITNVELGRSGKYEAGSWKHEAGSRETEPALGSFLSCNSNFLAPLSPLGKGDESRPLVAGTEGVKKLEDGRRKYEAGSTKSEAKTRNLEHETWNLQPATCNLQPVTTNSKYKANPFLPQGRFYSGDCPGAAAITIILSLFSSPRVSPNFAGANRLARQCILPVANQQASHQGSIVPLFKGDEIRFSESGGKWDESRFIGTGGIDDKTLNPRVQEVSSTSPIIRTKGFKSERRYAYVLN